MAVFVTGAIVEVSPVPAQMGFVVQPPMVFSAVAPEINADSWTSVEGGRYHDDSKELKGQASPLRQDSYITGTAGRSGRAFTSVSGTWRDDWINPQNGKYGMAMADGTGGVTAEIMSADTTTGIENCEIVLQRGFQPTGSTITTKADMYCYIELVAGSDLNYRIAAEYGEPFKLQKTWDTGATWQTIGHFRRVGQTDRHFKQNANEARFTIHADKDRDILTVELNDAGYTQGVQDPDVEGVRLIDMVGKIRVQVKNGWCNFQYTPLRYETITAQDNKGWDSGRDDLLTTGAVVKVNSLAITPETQTTQYAVASDGRRIKWTATAQTTGDSQGGYEPPILSDVTVLIPSVWTNTLDGIDLTGYGYLETVRQDESETLDEVNRTFSSSASILCDNSNSQYSGSFGHVYTKVSATNAGAGGAYYTRMSGIGGVGDRGIQFTSDGQRRLMSFDVADLSCVMQVPLGQEVIADGWCLAGLVRFMCENGNVNASRVSNLIPFWDYGPVSTADNCPYYTLPRGSGGNPRFRFTPEMTVWSILSRLAQDLAILGADGRVLPFYHGFSEEGLYGFGPFDLIGNPVVQNLTEPNIVRIAVRNEIQDLRTELTVQGIDGNTFELLSATTETPNWVKAAVGFRYVLIDRSARYCSADYVLNTLYGMQIQASLAAQWVDVEIPYLPWLHVGQNIMVSESRILGGSFLYNIKRIKSSLGYDGSMANPIPDCKMIVSARSLAKDY